MIAVSNEADTRQLNVGGHLSLGGKPRSTVQQTADDGFGCLQIFASSPGAWRPPIMTAETARDFVAARHEHGVDPLFIHAIYLINLGSEDPALVARSRASLIAALRAGALMGAAGVITHLGSHAGRGFEQVVGQISVSLAEVLEATPDQVRLILENSAGAGNIVGSRLTELGAIIRYAGSPSRLSVALDTAHLCGSGWDFTQDGAVETLVEEADREFGWQRVAVIHANDSAQPCGSRKDRHANIGDGHIGLEGFRRLLRLAPLRSLPWVLETPKLERRVEDRAALQALAVQELDRGSAYGS